MSEVYSTSSYKLIYIFTIPDEAHKGLVKVGEASIHTTAKIDELPPNCEKLNLAADKRIRQETYTAGVKYDLQWAQLAIRKRTDIFDGSHVTVIDNFRDHDVHDVLKNSGIAAKYPNGIKNREWFKCDVETAKRAIVAVIDRRAVLSEGEKTYAPIVPVIKLRDEQEGAVQRTLTIFEHENKVLWNCKMRFGKTLTAYELIRRGKFQKTLVVTHRPVVQEGWEEDHAKLYGKNSPHLFMKKQGNFYTEDYFDSSSDINNDIALNNAKRRGDYFTYFASMQDLRGSRLVGGKFDKNKTVFDMDWDLIIYDEAHEGTQTQLGQKVQALLEQPKNGKEPKVLELSGTPYNIMDKYEDNVCTWDYVMEQDAKAHWDYKHPNEPNPYADMPRMNIFTFDMSKALPTSYRFETETSAFNFREFFRVWTGDPKEDFGAIPQGKKKGDFVHEEDVRSFLNIITAESVDTKYPFATDEFRKEFKHTFWMLPGVKEARALSALLQCHAVFSHYKIVNVAGEGDAEMPYDNALDLVKEAIRDYEYTITLSCGKLTTGVTVPEWTAVMMLTGSATTDAKGYMQTIFRVQSAGIIEGKQKENCYVFDFAPDRALRVISEAHQLSKHGRLSDTQYKNELGKFLNYCPVHAIDGVRMIPYDVTSMMRQIKRINIDSAIKSGFEDDSIFKADAGVVMDERDREFFEALRSRLTGHKKTKDQSTVPMAQNGMTQEEYDRAEAAEKKPPRERTPEEKEAMEKRREARKEREKFISLLRNISIRLPLLIYGADVPLTENITMEKFTEIVDDESWKEFLPADVTKDLFKRSIKYFDEDVLIGAGLRIRRLVKQADEYPPTERIKRITELFNHFRNPDKETVLTPWRVVNMHMSDCLGGYCFLNEQFDPKAPLDEPRFVDRGQVTADLFKTNEAKILEINSKSGLYPLYTAYSIYRHLLPKREEDMPISDLYAVWNKVLENNIFVLCKTKMAQDITRRTLTGFTKAKVNTHYQPYLLERMKSDMDWVVKKLKNPAVWGKEGTSMKFDAIVGNPPYQGTNHSQVYPFFYLSAIKITNKYVSLIFPTGWQQPRNANNLKLLNNAAIKCDRQIVRINNLQNVFPGIPGAEWVNTVIWERGYDNGLDGAQLVLTNGNELQEVVFPIEESSVAKPSQILELFECVRAKGDFISVQTITSISKPYGIRKDIFANYEKYGLPPMQETRIEQTDISVYGSFGKIQYIPATYPLPRKTQAFAKYKVFVGSAWGNMSEKTGLGGAYADIIVAKPYEICTETYQESGCYDDLELARKQAKYLMTKFARALLYINKLSQMSTTAWGAVPVQDFHEEWWGESIEIINRKLMEKYNVPNEIADYVEDNIQTRTESNIINFNL